jgi:hypothetical protein
LYVRRDLRDLHDLLTIAEIGSKIAASAQDIVVGDGAIH